MIRRLSILAVGLLTVALLVAAASFAKPAGPTNRNAQLAGIQFTQSGGWNPGGPVTKGKPFFYGLNVANNRATAIKNLKIDVMLKKQHVVKPVKFLLPPGSVVISKTLVGNHLVIVIKNVPGSYTVGVGLTVMVPKTAKGPVCNLLVLVADGKRGDYSNPYGSSYNPCGAV